MPYGIESNRMRQLSPGGVIHPDQLLDKQQHMSRVNESSDYLTASQIWPLVVNVSDDSLPGNEDSQREVPRALALHPLAIAGMKVTALGLSYLLENSFDTMRKLATQHILHELDTKDDVSYDNYPTFQEYLNADDSMIRYDVSEDRIAVHLAGSAPPTVLQGETLAAHQVVALGTEADRLGYYHETVAPHVPQLLLQRLLHDNMIRKNRVPDSQVVYEVLAGQSFSLINIYLQLYIKGNELSIDFTHCHLQP